LIAENAKWRLKSDSIRFVDDVGRKVKVCQCGFEPTFSPYEEDPKAEVEKSPTETGVLTVTNLEIVSENCN
jgi:hypothetical protein